MIDDSVVLVTGGTGSFGQAFALHALQNYKPKKIIVFSRDEMKQWEMAQRFAEYSDVIRFFVGDVRDLSRLALAMRQVDFVIHAAAMKIVPIAEYNPFECINTNINGSMNVISAALECGVKKVVALSTDKASNPANLYGATKLASDKLFVNGNFYAGYRPTKFCVVRYGNVMGSRGSVIPFFRDLVSKGVDHLPITHREMTRFMIRLEEGVDFVLRALNESNGGEIFVKKIPSMRLVDIANAIAPNSPIKIVGIRPGEKIHEQMIGSDDARSTYEFQDYYKILPNHSEFPINEEFSSGGQKVSDEFSYVSSHNTVWMSCHDLRQWMQTQYPEDSY